MGNNEIAVLHGRRVLVVEDEPLVSMALTDELERAGAIVVGPAASVEGALDLIATSQIDAAILDLELQQKLVYPVAELLMGLGVPFILTTGHDAEVIPEQFAAIPNSPKPAPTTEVLQTLAGSLEQCS